jgi:hypothetical protein
MPFQIHLPGQEVKAIRVAAAARHPSTLKYDPKSTMAVTPKETKDAHKIPKPAPPQFQNQQLSLFQSFLCNTDAERYHLSNLIDLWDNVPRYSVSRQAMTKNRIQGRFLEKHEAEFQYKGRTFVRTLTPARVEDLDGIDRDFYASATEELVEDALRKLAAEQQSGYFDKPNYRSGVVFTLYAMREELKRRGHTRSYQQIILALNILSGSIIDITVRDPVGETQFVTRSAYLPHLSAVSQGRLREDPKAKWVVQFHPLVTGSIDKVTYRQFNYDLMMSHTTQLARWLHKQLALKYTFASLTTPFEMRYTTIKRDSGLLEQYARPRDAIDALSQAFTELKKHGVLLGFDRKDITGLRNKLLDVTFTLTPSFDFVRDTKAGSKRLALATANGVGTR